MRAALLGVLVLVVSCGDAGPKHQASSSAMAAAPSSPPPSPALPRLPPDPPPAAAKLAHEAPDLEQKILADQAYEGIWSRPRAERDLFLTAVSQLLADSFLVGGAKKITDAGGKQAAIWLHLYELRVGEYPKDFTQRVEEVLAATKSERRLGTWSESPERAHDYSVLAARIRRLDPEYLREMIAARSTGWFRWLDGEHLGRFDYFWSERAALDRLALLSPLTDEEAARLGVLRKQEVERAPGVTMANYKRIETGMSYAAVAKLLGSPGEELSSSEMAGIKTVMFVWKGSGVSNMNAMFQNDKLVSKAQFGL